MQSIRYLNQWLVDYADNKHYLFTTHQLAALYPHLSYSALKTLLSRAVYAKLLIRVCRGIYLYRECLPNDGLLLFHMAKLLRANTFNYISLETVLSDAGVISQIPINRITIMSSGRSNTIHCGEFGSIEFIHTQKKPIDLIDYLIYDNRYGMWRANVLLAIKDMKATHRNCDLIDWDTANELI